MKDHGRSHYRFHSVNISTEDLDAAKRMYMMVRTTHEDGRKLIGKRSALRMAWQEWNTYLSPLVIPLDVVLLWMVRSGAYMPTSDWAVGTGGRGFAMRKSNAMWWMARWPERTNIGMIRDLFFDTDDRFTGRARPLMPSPSGMMYNAPPTHGDDESGDLFADLSNDGFAAGADFVPLYTVCPHKHWHEMKYEEAKDLCMEARSFRRARPDQTGNPTAFPEPTHGRPSEQPSVAV